MMIIAANSAEPQYQEGHLKASTTDTGSRIMASRYTK
jgi:hypothetical protein